MKFASLLAIAVLCHTSAEALNLHAEPVGKTGPVTDEEKKEIDDKKAASEERKDAKLKENAEKVKVMKEEAVKAEMKAQDDADAELKRQTIARMSAYDKNMKDQKDETARIAAIKAPIDVGVMQAHDKSKDTAGEHWTANMPDHIISNKVGPTFKVIPA